MYLVYDNSKIFLIQLASLKKWYYQISPFFSLRNLVKLFIFFFHLKYFFILQTAVKNDKLSCKKLYNYFSKSVRKYCKKIKPANSKKKNHK